MQYVWPARQTYEQTHDFYIKTEVLKWWERIGLSISVSLPLKGGYFFKTKILRNPVSSYDA